MLLLPATPVPAATTLAARVLGRFEVRVDGREVAPDAWERSGSRRLVELLLITGGHRLRREAAIDSLWPGRDPAAGLSALRKSLHYARRALGDPGLLVADRQVVGLDTDRLDLDLDRLTAALARVDAASGPPGGPPAGTASVDDARIVCDLGLLELLPDEVYEEWVDGARFQLWSASHRCALSAARTMQAAGAIDEARTVVDRILAREPADEAAHRLAIELFVAEGRHDAARRQLELCREVLRRELDVEPSAETAAALGSAARGSAARGAVAPGPAAHGAAAVAAVGRTGRDPWLVGRDHERRRIEEALVRAGAGRCSTLVVRGPTGIGKTRLLHELVATARTAGWHTLEWQAVESHRSSPFAPIRSALATGVADTEVRTWQEPARSAVAALLPGMDLPRSLVFGDRAALVTGVHAAIERLAAARPVVLAWDDLPWLDAASLQVLRSIIAASPPVPLLLAGTLRDDEPLPPAVEDILDLVARAGGLDLRVGPLGRDQTEPLVLAHLGGNGLHETLAGMLFEVSAGNPLFCLELARSLAAEGAISCVDGHWSGSPGADGIEVPASVGRLVARRVRRLSPRARELLDVAAEVSAVAGFELLVAAVPGRSAANLRALDEALGSGLLVERPGGYAFAHPLFRAAMREGRSSARRAGIRLAIAQAKAGIPAGAGTGELLRAVATCPDPVVVAEHALAAVELGSPVGHALAAAFGFAGGIRLRHLFENARSREMLEAALAAWDQLPPDVAAELDASAALVTLGELRSYAGDDDGAEAALRRAVRVARTPDEIAEAYLARHRVPYRHGDFTACLAILEEGLEILPPGPSIAKANLEREVGWILLRLRREEDATPLLHSSLAASEEVHDQQGRMRALDMLGNAAWGAGRSLDAITLEEQALAIAIEVGDSEFEAICRMHLASALADEQRFDLGRHHVERAIELCRLTGNRYDESVACWIAADLEDDAGRDDRSITWLHEELRLLALLGGNPRHEALAHAHLALLARRRGDRPVADRETGIARELAADAGGGDGGAWIERILAVEHWADVRLT